MDFQLEISEWDYEVLCRKTNSLKFKASLLETCALLHSSAFALGGLGKLEATFQVTYEC